MTESAPQQRYWLGDSRPEVDHLLAQAEFLGPDASPDTPSRQQALTQSRSGDQ
jgi:hypothetical protein